MMCVRGGGTCAVGELVLSLYSFPPQCRGKEEGGSLLPTPHPRCRSDRSCHWRPQRDMELRKDTTKHLIWEFSLAKNTSVAVNVGLV